MLYYVVFFPFLFFLYLGTIKKINPKLIFTAVLAVYVYGALLTLVFSPSPVCDCFTTVKESAQFFLSGKNPYNALFSPVYKGVIPDYFPHLPFSFIWVSPFVLLFADPRFSTIFTAIASAVLLYKMLRSAVNDNSLFVIIASFLFLPRSFYMLEHMYQEINIFFFFLLFIYLMGSKRKKSALFSLSLFFSFKQHLILLLPFFLMHKNLRKVMKANVFYFLLPFAMPFIYFLVNPHAFVKNIFFFTSLNTFTKALPLTRSMSISTFLYQFTGISLTASQIVSGALFCILYLVLLRTSRSFYKSIAVCLFLMHLTLSYSFFNHYYLIQLFLLFSIVVHSQNAKLALQGD